MQDTPDSAGRMVLVAVLFEGGLALAAVLAGWLFDHDPLLHIRWTWEAAGWGAAATLPLLVMMFGCARTALAPCRRMTQLVRRLILPFFRHATWIDLALVSLTAGLGEELLFRGLLQSIVTEWTNVWIGLTIASVLFGLAHLITPTYGVLATLVGAYLGGLGLVCDNLLAPIVTHALYDFLALLYLLRTNDPDLEQPANPP